jgi:uncharacterized protein with ParB-like and HNH nuclease domain
MEDIFLPQSLTISQIFIDGDPLYQIPNYQRPYSWMDDQIEKLWEDIYDTAYSNNKEDSTIDTNYFLGSVIIVKQQNGFEDVVDGQQRLTTLMILMNVIQKLYPKINQETDPAKVPSVVKIGKINNCIRNSNELNRLRLYTHPTHQGDFDEYIVGCNDMNSLKKPTKKEIEKEAKFRFINTAVFFRNKLLELGENETGLMVNYLFNHVKLIKISCSNRNFAIKLFQVLNDRGLDLSPADIIKSYLMQSLEELEQQRFMADWQNIEDSIEKLDISLTELFTLYEYYKLGSNPKKSLTDELEKIFRGTNSNEIIRDIKKFLTKYHSDIYGNENDKVIHSFWYLGWTVYWKSILLTALHSNYSDYEKLKNLLRRFYYLFWIAGKTLSAIKQTSFNLIGKIKANEPIKKIEKMLNEKITELDIINMALNNLSGDIYQQPWVKPVLILIEYQQLDTDFVGFIFWDKNLQIEHIIPQSFERSPEWEHIDKDFGNKYLHKAGNITLLSARKNIEAQNYSFKTKIEIYKGSGKDGTKKEGITSFRISQKIVDEYNSNKFKKNWNEEAVKDRHNWLLGQLGEVLDIDTSSIKV